MTVYSEVWADNTTGTLSAPATSGASTFSVTTTTGTFPVPTSTQAFHVVIDFGTTASEIVPVKTNASGVFTLVSGSTLEFSHLQGAQVSCCLTAEGLNTLVSANAPVGFFGVTPVTRQATPVTLANVISLLQAYGLSQ